MKLEAVTGGRRAPVIADGDGQEMILDIRIGNAFGRADEAKRLELVRRAEPTLEEQPFGADPRLGEKP